MWPARARLWRSTSRLGLSSCSGELLQISAAASACVHAWSRGGLTFANPKGDSVIYSPVDGHHLCWFTDPTLYLKSHCRCRPTSPTRMPRDGRGLGFTGMGIFAEGSGGTCNGKIMFYNEGQYIDIECISKPS